MPTINGTSQDDEIFPNSDEGTLFLGNLGDDTLFSGLGNDTLNGGPGSDFADYSVLFQNNPLFVNGVTADLTSGRAHAEVDGRSISDTLIAIESLQGTRFDDTLTGDNGNNEIQGGSGNDFIRGNGGNDYLFPGKGNDSVYGELGDDSISAGRDGGVYHGGDGVDWVSYGTVDRNGSIFVNGVEVSLQHGFAIATFGGVRTVHTLDGIENAQGSVGDDTLRGDVNDNLLSGLSGDDALYGLAGNDAFFPGLGDDTLDGGLGIDALTYDASIFAGGVEVDLAIGRALVSGNGQSFEHHITNIEELFGSPFDDSLLGSSENDYLQGNDGDDLVFGGAGDDTIWGSDGIDIALYEGPSTQFTIQISADGAATRIVDRTGREGTDTGGTDILRFSDMDWLLVDPSRPSYEFQDLEEGAVSALVEIYVAYFNRAPDSEGLRYWIDVAWIDPRLTVITEAFFDQPETRALYGDTIDTSDFVSTVYRNVLNRDPDVDGHDFWVRMIDEGLVSQGEFILELIDGVKSFVPFDAPDAFREQKEADWLLLHNKTALGIEYGATRGLNDVEMARAVMETFDGSRKSFEKASDLIESAYIDAITGDETEFLVQIVGVEHDPVF